MVHRRSGIILLLLGAVSLTGCAPKRVGSDGVVVTDPAPRPVPPRTAGGRIADGRTAGDSATEAPSRTDLPGALPGPEPLPDPELLARSGTAVLPAKRTPPAAAPSLGARAVELARKQLGKPYQWGAAGPDRFDCSGLVQYVYSNLGVPLPRVSRQQASAGVHIDRQDLRAGDLVFFRLSGSRIDHVGIYVGRGKFIHAPNKHRPVQTDSLNDSWWRRRFKGGRRVG